MGLWALDTICLTAGNCQGRRRAKSGQTFYRRAVHFAGIQSTAWTDALGSVKAAPLAFGSDALADVVAQASLLTDEGGTKRTRA